MILTHLSPACIPDSYWISNPNNTLCDAEVHPAPSRRLLWLAQTSAINRLSADRGAWGYFWIAPRSSSRACGI